MIRIIRESLVTVQISRDDFDRMCRENSILKGLSSRDYIEIRDSFNIGYENFDAAVNDLWDGDDGYHSRDWYEDLLKKYINSVEESLKESSDDSTKDLNRYEFLVKRYGHEEDRETITAVSLEDAEDQLNSDGHVEYWDYLPDFNYDIDESLKESLNLNEAKNIINVLNKNLRVRFKHSAGGIFSLDRTPFNTDIFDELIKNNYKMIGDILEEQGLKYDISEDAYISKDENLYVTIYGDTGTVIVQFDEM